MKLRAPGYILAGLGSIGGAATAATADPDSPAMAIAPAIPLAGMTPALVDEIQATRKGLQALRAGSQYSPEVLKAMRGNLLKALGTYGGLTAAMTLPAATIAAYRHFKPREKTAALEESLLSLFAHSQVKPRLQAKMEAARHAAQNIGQPERQWSREPREVFLA